MEAASLAPTIACVIAFLFGSIPFGLFIGRLFKVADITQHGSGNIGATNISRVIGFWPAGLLTFLLDCAKGAAPILSLNYYYSPQLLSSPLQWCAGLCAVAGHCYSPWLRFRGGKGVATGFGVILVLSPLTALAGAIVFGLTFISQRIGSLSSLTALLFAVVTELTIYPIGPHLWFGAFMAFIILLRHESNIDSLLKMSLPFLFLLTNTTMSSAISTSGIEIVDATGYKLRLADKPRRIVTLAPSLGELAADLSGDEIERVVGVSDFTDYPPALRKVASVGPYFKFNIEKVVSLKPDLILATTDGNAKDQVLHLRELGLPVVTVATDSFRAVEESIRLCAIAMGAVARGTKMLEQLKIGIDNLKKQAVSHQTTRQKPKVLLQVGDEPLVVVGGRSFLHEALEALGGINIYADAKVSYPRPSIEDVISKNPDVVLVLGLNSDLTPFNRMADNWKRFKTLEAVKKHKVKVLAADSLTRPSLRLLEGLALLEKALW